MRGVLLDVIYEVPWKGDILVENCIKEKVLFSKKMIFQTEQEGIARRPVHE